MGTLFLPVTIAIENATEGTGGSEREFIEIVEVQPVILINFSKPQIPWATPSPQLQKI